MSRRVYLSIAATVALLVAVIAGLIALLLAAGGMAVVTTFGATFSAVLGLAIAMYPVPRLATSDVGEPAGGGRCARW